MSVTLDEKRKAKAETNGRPGEPVPAWKAKPQHPAPEGITASDLIDLDLPLPRFLVDGLLAEGLTVLGGKPKHGKSWLALLLAWAVAAPRPLDGRSVRPAEVLYLALEDTRRRLKGRLSMLRGALEWPVPKRLTLSTTWPRACEGGLYYIAEWLEARKDADRFVIVDTLGKFRTPPKGSGGSSYAEDYEAIGGLKGMLDNYGASGLVVHHTRKLRSEDPFDEISGTLAITGAADSIWMLDTQTKGADARLYVTGRDLPDATVPMAFLQQSGRWVVGASADGINTDGRDTSGAGAATSKLEQCKTWVKEFLREYAYPSAEIEGAGRAAGFAPTTIRDAKVALGSKGTGEVVHRNFGGDQNNDWWSGIGPATFWKRRPPPETAK